MPPLVCRADELDALVFGACMRDVEFLDETFAPVAGRTPDDLLRAVLAR